MKEFIKKFVNAAAADNYGGYIENHSGYRDSGPAEWWGFPAPFRKWWAPESHVPPARSAGHFPASPCPGPRPGTCRAY